MSWLILAYIVVACVFAVATWIDNATVYYVNGPPSGFLTGLFWPVVLLIAGLSWLFDPFRERIWKRAAPTNPQTHTDGEA